MKDDLALTSRNQEQNRIRQEPNHLHPLPPITLVVNHERRQVISAKPDTDVEQVPEPIVDKGRVGRDDLDEAGSEELVAVEQEIVEEPSEGGADHAAGEVGCDEFEGLDIVA